LKCELKEEATTLAQDEINVYDAIISAQKFDGSFDLKLSANLLEQIGQKDASETLCAILMLLWLERKFNSRRDEFVLMFEKTVEWLESKGIDY